MQGDIIRTLRRLAWKVIIVCCRDREGLSEMKNKDTIKELAKWLSRSRHLLCKT